MYKIPLHTPPPPVPLSATSDAYLDAKQTGRAKSVHMGGLSTKVGCPQGGVLLHLLWDAMILHSSLLCLFVVSLIESLISVFVCLSSAEQTSKQSTWHKSILISHQILICEDKVRSGQEIISYHLANNLE